MAISEGKFGEAGSNAYQAVLQNNKITIKFDPAADKTRLSGEQANIKYQVRYRTVPLYFNNKSDKYLKFDTEDNQKTISEWTNITGSIIGGKVNIVVTTPIFDVDKMIQYEVRPLDDKLPNSALDNAEVGKTPYFGLIVNRPSKINMNMVDWQSNGAEIQVEGAIIEIGFSTPFNYDEIEEGSSVAWQNWRNDLSTLLGDIEFNYQLRYADSEEGLYSEEVKKISINGFSLNEEIADYWPIRRTFSLIIDILSEEIDSSKSYYLLLYLVASGASNGAVLTTEIDYAAKSIVLISDTPVFQIKKGVVKANIPNSNKNKTGGGMFSHGPQINVGQDYDKGHSITLYDHHINTNNEVGNSPSIGFMSTEQETINEKKFDKELASIRYKEDSEKQGLFLSTENEEYSLLRKYSGWYGGVESTGAPELIYPVATDSNNLLENIFYKGGWKGENAEYWIRNVSEENKPQDFPTAWEGISEGALLDFRLVVRYHKELANGDDHWYKYYLQELTSYGGLRPRTWSRIVKVFPGGHGGESDEGGAINTDWVEHDIRDHASLDDRYGIATTTKYGHIKIDQLYPINSVYTAGNKNINPALILGGTWALESKVCSYRNIPIGDIFTVTAGGITITNSSVSIINNILTIYMLFQINTTLSIVLKEVGKFDFSGIISLSKILFEPTCGISNSFFSASSRINIKNSPCPLQLALNSGTVSATNEVNIVFSIPLNSIEINDNVCNEWHWRRTA